MKNLRWGLMAASLSAGMILGGSALAQSAQQPDMSPSATQPSATAPENSAKPMSEQPSMSQSQDQSMPRDNDQNRDSMGQDRSRNDRDPLTAKGDSDTTKRDVRDFDNFLDKHPEVAQDLRNDPSKVNDTAFVSSHKELQRWLEKHPQIRDEIRENPSAFMHREKQYERNENKPQ